jgi:hypothetical protein
MAQLAAANVAVGRWDDTLLPPGLTSDRASHNAGLPGISEAGATRTQDLLLIAKALLVQPTWSNFTRPLLSQPSQGGSAPRSALH